MGTGTRSARRVVVVGAGVTGLVTAVACVLAGHQVTVLDRGAIPHPGSSSFDQHRAIRALDPEDLPGTRRAALAHQRWLELETLLCGSRPGVGFYRRVGVLTGWPGGQVEQVAQVAADAGLSVKLVEPDEVGQIRFPAGARAVLELDAGVLLADRVLWAAARWLARHPAARLRAWSPVVSVDTDRAQVVLADGGCEQGDLVLVAGGPWTRSLVDVPTVLYRQTMVYLRPPADLARWWDTAPSAGRVGADGRAWLLPSGAGALLKVSTDAACRVVADPDDDEPADERHWADRIMAAGILTGMDRYTVAAVKRCHYAVDAATGGAHLVRLGPAVFARAASGGDGFRTAPLVADRIVAALRPTATAGLRPLATDRRASLDIF
ncbi:FAD-dependent oxidoreductase [Solwaraspora sp. WMMD791]|uniref:FAD-dependent oxidoreductase n=1 Tax=Solwaraspora sp. WMMD791 TaxID=3016086 RepID=UPI00249A9D8B|nr:FAD-dependent oxidoreductase [Solwaraspora sp. WMMD791]WFE29628.1 FAD-dependent oxidoreductase [Solwaraspora sp. WMMD791]